MPIKFCSEAYFFRLGSLTSLKSQTRDPPLKVPPGGHVLRIFTPCKKGTSTSVGFELVNLGSRGEHVTPRSTRGNDTQQPSKTIKVENMKNSPEVFSRSESHSQMLSIIWLSSLSNCSAICGEFH